MCNIPTCIVKSSGQIYIFCHATYLELMSKLLLLLYDRKFCFKSSVLQKLIIDEKKYYLFGRNPDMCDFTIDHQSCSRVHAALVYHKHLKRVFLMDLNSSKSSCYRFVIVTHTPNTSHAHKCTFCPFILLCNPLLLM